MAAWLSDTRFMLLGVRAKLDVCSVSPQRRITFYDPHWALAGHVSELLEIGSGVARPGRAAAHHIDQRHCI